MKLKASMFRERVANACEYYFLLRSYLLLIDKFIDMRKYKYAFLLVFVLIIIGIWKLTSNPNGENTIEKITSLNNLNRENSNNNNKVSDGTVAYEIKNIKAITSENYYSTPSFSPDGKKIAITNLNFKGIIVEDIADGTKKKITEDEGAGFRYSWSPDSKAITYLSRKNINGEAINIIKIVEIDNGKAFDLTSPGIGASMPTFTQSNEVIYSFKGTLIKRKWSNGTIGNEEIIAENVPANIIIPSPKNDKLVIEDDNGIKIIDIDGKNKKTLVKNGENNFACDAKVSLDGSKVLYANTVGSKGHLFVYEINNEKITDLGEGIFGQWLLDGRIIYCITMDDGNVNTASELYIINIDGTGKKKITDTPNQIEIQPTVSSDCKSIVFRDDKSGIIYIGELKTIVKN
jgi:Tol biopolymer transport system component